MGEGREERERKREYLVIIMVLNCQQNEYLIPKKSEGQIFFDEAYTSVVVTLCLFRVCMIWFWGGKKEARFQMINKMTKEDEEKIAQNMCI